MGNDIVWHNKVGGKSREFIRANALSRQPLILYNFEPSAEPAYTRYYCKGAVSVQDGVIGSNILEPDRDPWFSFILFWTPVEERISMDMGSVGSMGVTWKRVAKNKNQVTFQWKILFNGEVWAMQPPLCAPPTRRPTFGDRTMMCEAVDAFLSSSDAT